MKLSISATLLLALAITCAAADLAGKWTGELPGRQAAAGTFVFNVEGEKLTGTLTTPQGEVPIQDGKVTGDKITFSTAGRNAKVLFAGTVTGDEIKMTRTREGGQSREFTLKRAK